MPGAESVVRRILVVDDEEDNRELVATVLRMDLDVSVDAAANGREAVTCCEREHHAVVVLDMAMPKMDGFAAAAAIRALPFGDRVHIVAASAFSREGDFDRARALGIVDYLVKPVDLQELTRRVRDALDGADAPSSHPRS